MRIKETIVILLMLVPLCLRAQLPRTSPYENRIILLAQVDRNTLKRIVRYDTKYFYVAGGEGIRLHDPFGQSNFYYAALATSLPLDSHFKLGTSYYLMSVRSSSTGAWRWSHRLNLDGTFRYKTPTGWIFTCRERLQYTYKMYDPGLLEVRNAFLLRSKFQIKYQGFPIPLACYAFVELRNTLNKPSAAVQDGAVVPGDGFDVYLNRIKSSVCVEWKITRQHTLCLYGLFDYDINRKYYVAASDAVSYDIEEDFLPSIGVRFKYLF